MWLCEMEMRELEVCVRDGDERARGLPEMERDEMEIERDRARLRQLEKRCVCVNLGLNIFVNTETY